TAEFGSSIPWQSPCYETSGVHAARIGPHQDPVESGGVCMVTREQDRETWGRGVVFEESNGGDEWDRTTAYRTGSHYGKGPKGYRRSDERIHADISDVLMRDGYLDASDITVHVTNGGVTLEGTVPDRRMMRDAEDCSRAILGVVDVLNLLEVRDAPVPP